MLDNTWTYAEKEAYVHNLFQSALDTTWEIPMRGGTSRHIRLTDHGWGVENGGDLMRRVLAHSSSSERMLRYSSFALRHATFPETVTWEDIALHEAAHALHSTLTARHGVPQPSDHGRVWVGLCHVTGAEPRRTASNIKWARGVAKYDLTCPKCAKHIILHRKTQRRYGCASCGRPGNFVPFTITKNY